MLEVFQSKPRSYVTTTTSEKHKKVLDQTDLEKPYNFSLDKPHTEDWTIEQN